MRLFSAIFSALAAQALLVTVVAGGLLVWNMHSGYSAQLAAQDRERLSAFAQRATEVAITGRPLDRFIADFNMTGDNRLAGRVQLASPEGQAVTGPGMAGEPIAQEAVEINGRTIGILRVTRPAQLNDADREFLGMQYIGIGAILFGMLAILLLAAYLFARRWSRPQVALYRMSHDIVQGDHDVYFEEQGYAETAATMRNLHRVAQQFSRLETARRTWLVTIADELQQPVHDLEQRLERLAEAEPPVDQALLMGLAEDHHILNRMAKDLGAVALSDLGRLPVEFAQVDPRALIHNAIWSNGKRAEAGGVRLETSTLPEYTILVKWDGARVEQLFGALIENSLRYTPPGGQIVLGLESSRDAWRLIIDDSAPGVDVELAQRLFEPFYRSSERADSKRGVSGLGLATARAIVDAHHGRIEAGRSPIGGLRVVVILPSNPPTA
ncbi:ATP-binding protein [Sphingosinithalassobacter portus]|uniref:ATP-binding protein n=1 Tax=Stakelama portus TaxID=2676234 RepID=UPI000D6EA015|nr:ATP-binding protein [Sphingosinithalassobacter portus]